MRSKQCKHWRRFNTEQAAWIREKKAAHEPISYDALPESFVNSIKANPVMGHYCEMPTDTLRQLINTERKAPESRIGPGIYLTTPKSKQEKALTSQPQNFQNNADEEQDDVCWIDEHLLNIDESYQRLAFLNKGLVNFISNNFDADACHVLTVAQRKDGSYWVVDGMHRLLGGRKAGIKRFRCRLFPSEGNCTEADMFTRINIQRTNVSSLSNFKARCTAGERIATEIQAILSKYGFSVDGGRIGAFKACTALEKAHKSGVLDDVLFIISQSDWNSSARWNEMLCQANLLQMLTIFLVKFAGKVNKDRIVQILQQMAPSTYQAFAGRFAGATGSRAQKMAVAFVDEYNKCLRKGRIEWK